MPRAPTRLLTVSQPTHTKSAPDRRGDRLACRRSDLPNARRRARRHRTRGNRRPRLDRRNNPSRVQVDCSSSLAPTPRPPGSRRRSHSTRRATCSPAPTRAPPDNGSLTGTLPPRDKRPRHLRLRRRPLQPRQTRRRRSRRRQHGNRLRASKPQRARQDQMMAVKEILSNLSFDRRVDSRASSARRWLVLGS